MKSQFSEFGAFPPTYYDFPFSSSVLYADEAVERPWQTAITDYEKTELKISISVSARNPTLPEWAEQARNLN